MGQILAVYMGLAIVVCHFFRKFCQDPALEEQQAEEDDKLAQEMVRKNPQVSINTGDDA